MLRHRSLRRLDLSTEPGVSDGDCCDGGHADADADADGDYFCVMTFKLLQ